MKLSALLLASVLLLSVASAQRSSYSDGSLRVTLRYRMGTVPLGGIGIEAGRLILETGSRRYSYNIAQILPISTHHVEIPDGPNDGCGATAALGHRGRYVVIESFWAEKGCRPAAAFIDISSGQIATIVDVDHRFAHANDVVPFRFHGAPIRISSAELVILRAENYNPRNGAKTIPWNFILIHGVDAARRPRLLAFEAGSEEPPAPGSDVYDGILDDPYGLHYHPDALMLRLSAVADAGYAARQTPPPASHMVTWRRNQWFIISDYDAAHGHFTAALAAYAAMLSSESDPGLKASETAELPACRALANGVRTGRVSSAAAKAAWQRHC